MPQPNEKQAFSGRLLQALKRSPKRVESATDLALQFNLRHPNDPITPQAAQKWLSGKAKPTADKIETLADWLNVSSHWLRYGLPEHDRSMRQDVAQTSNVDPLTEDELRFIIQLRKLSEYQQGLIIDLVGQINLNVEAGSVSDG